MVYRIYRKITLVMGIIKLNIWIGIKRIEQTVFMTSVVILLKGDCKSEIWFWVRFSQ